MLYDGAERLLLLEKIDYHNDNYGNVLNQVKGIVFSGLV